MRITFEDGQPVRNPLLSLITATSDADAIAREIIIEEEKWKINKVLYAVCLSNVNWLREGFLSVLSNVGDSYHFAVSIIVFQYSRFDRICQFLCVIFCLFLYILIQFFMNL